MEIEMSLIRPQASVLPMMALTGTDRNRYGGRVAGFGRKSGFSENRIFVFNFLTARILVA